MKKCTNCITMTCNVPSTLHLVHLQIVPKSKHPSSLILVSLPLEIFRALIFTWMQWPLWEQGLMAKYPVWFNCVNSVTQVWWCFICPIVYSSYAFGQIVNWKMLDYNTFWVFPWSNHVYLNWIVVMCQGFVIGSYSCNHRIIKIILGS